MNLDEYNKFKKEITDFIASNIKDDPNCWYTNKYNKTYMTKNAYRKLADRFGLVDEPPKHTHVSLPNNGFGEVVTIVVKGNLPGTNMVREASGVGAVSNTEAPNPQEALHFCASVAHVRAKNRAVSEWCGLEENSAEEMANIDTSKPHPQSSSQNNSQNQSTKSPNDCHCNPKKISLEDEKTCVLCNKPIEEKHRGWLLKKRKKEEGIE